MNIYAIEGVDNSGKSTLAKALAHRLRAVYIKSSETKIADPALYASFLLRVGAIARTFAPVVLDRFTPISEYVYGHVLRGESQYVLDEVKGAVYDVHLVYCRPPSDYIFRNAGRPQMTGVISNHRSLLDRYDELIDRLPPHCLRYAQYDWTVDSPEDLITRLTK